MAHTPPAAAAAEAAVTGVDGGLVMSLIRLKWRTALHSVHNSIEIGSNACEENNNSKICVESA